MRPLCKIEAGKVTPCPTLDKALEDHYTRKGLSLFVLHDLKTMETTRRLVIAKSGEFTKDGLVLNFCPWCGTQIREGDVDE